MGNVGGTTVQRTKWVPTKVGTGEKRKRGLQEMSGLELRELLFNR